MPDFLHTIGDVYRRMSHAAMRGGREPDAAHLVAVSKTVPVEVVREAVDCGLRVFGESRVREAAAKAAALSGLGLSWHMVGHLQRNKARQAVEVFDLIHSVDNMDLLGLIEKHAGAIGKRQAVLIQVKLSGEQRKSGCDEATLRAMVDAAAGMEHVEVRGLMTVPPFFDDPEAARPYFRRLYEINETYGFPELSMGMTGDFEAAIEEGATLVRVGTALFGERDYA